MPTDQEQEIIAALSSLEMAVGFFEKNWPSLEGFDADDIREYADRLTAVCEFVELKKGA